MGDIRTPHVAGTFYPADPEKLKNDVRALLDVSKPEKEFNNIFGLVSPHAGYVIISPSHSEYFPGVSVFNGDAYETPLGILQVDNEFADKLVENSRIIFRGIEGHRKEHALEVQLPFLQSVLDNFKIVPVVMGDQGKMYVDELSTKLAESADDDTLIVASSDMSHFYSKSEAEKLDSIIEKRINDFDYNALQEDLNTHNTEACGGGPIIAMMKAAALKNKNHSTVVHRSDSGDVTGDNREVVGYLSAVVYGD